MALKNKYQKEKQQYSVDGGLNWVDVSPARYRRGRLLEIGSEDCNTVEWREVEGSWFCIEFAETIYRWVDSGTYDCLLGDKYIIEKEQVSRDGGSTWTDTGETRDGEIIRDSEDCSTIDYENEALTIEVMSDTATIYSNYSGLEYKIDNGEWQLYNGAIEATLGQKIQWRGHLTNAKRVFSVSNNKQIRVFGNINSVFEYDTLTSTCYNCSNFFDGNDNLIDAEHLILPATTLIQSAYKCMFVSCHNLVTPPTLPATTIAIDCYSQMFKFCTSMTTAPALPALTMEQGCYYQMFGACSSLTTPPALPATTLAAGCYMQMFQQCTNMTSAPALPALTMEEDSYEGMFKECYALATAPALPATTLAEYCYRSMFESCINLVNVPSTLPATTLAEYCYYQMFKKCTSLTTAPVLPALTFVGTGFNNVANYAYSEMFKYCSSLNYIKMMIVDIPSGYQWLNFTSDWVYGVAHYGTFVKNGGAMWDEIGFNGVPGSWTIQYDGSGTRWVTVSGQYVCQGNDKYTMEKEQVTTDGGQTWVDTGDTRAGTLIEASSQDCLYATEYLTITSLANNNNIYWTVGTTLSGYGKSIYISTDNGQTWTSKLSQRSNISVSIATLNIGDKLLIKGNQTSYTNTYPSYFRSSDNVDVSGNIMSLLYEDNFAGQTTLTGTYTFQRLFGGLKVVNAENLVLPATTLAYYCYSRMFESCTTLVTAPKLPAVVLTIDCYASMFNGCRSLTTAPELTARTLADGCYTEMFNGCRSLNSITCLATDISASGCTTNWVTNVAANGTFTKASSMSDWTTGNNGIPSGWTVVDA